MSSALVYPASRVRRTSYATHVDCVRFADRAGINAVANVAVPEIADAASVASLLISLDLAYSVRCIA